MDMKSLWIVFLLAVSCLVAEAAVPQLTDFNTNQFGTAAGIVTIKNGALVTNLVGAAGDWTNNAGVVQLTTQTNLTNLGNTNGIPGSGHSHAAIPSQVSANIILRDDMYTGERGAVFTQPTMTQNFVLGWWVTLDPTDPSTSDSGGGNYPTALWAENFTRSISPTQNVLGYSQGSYGVAGECELFYGNALSLTNADSVGVFGSSGGGSAFRQYGTIGFTYPAFSNQTNVALAGRAGTFSSSGFTGVKTVGSYAEIVDDPFTTVPPNFESSVALFDNRTSALSVLIVRTNQTHVFEVDGSGHTIVGRLLTSESGRVINRFATATNYSLTVANHYLVSTATQTNTLPAANAVAAGQIFIIKNKSGTTTVRPAGADTIDGVAADDVLAAKASNTYISDGVSNWEKN